MTFSKNRFKKILKKNNFQTRKKFNKKKVFKKNNSFRKKNKINIRKKSIKQYKKRYAKKKRKVYIRGGGNDGYNTKIAKMLDKFFEEKNIIYNVNSTIKYDKHYNFDFLKDDNNNQQILNSNDVENEFNRKLSETERLAEQKRLEEQEKRDDATRLINESTSNTIEDGKENCVPQVFISRNGNTFTAFTDSCPNDNDINNWFQTIYDGL